MDVSVNMHDKFQQSLPISLLFTDGLANIAQRQVRTVPNCAHWTVDMPVIVNVTVVDITVVAQRPFPVVQFSRPPSFPSCSPLTRCSTSGASGEETVEIPQLQHVEAWTLLLTCPLVCNDRCRGSDVRLEYLVVCCGGCPCRCLSVFGWSCF